MSVSKQAPCDNIIDELEDLVRRMIQVPSLTPVTPDLEPATSQVLDMLEDLFSRMGANCERLRFEGGHRKWNYPVENLFVEFGQRQHGRQLCYLGHVDVVKPGDTESWSEDPYRGSRKGDIIFGRGATDMKGAIAAFVSAMAEVMASLGPGETAPAVCAVITGDEEWAAVNGTDRVLEWMRESGRRPSGFLVGEPSSKEKFGTTIKIGRRGSLCGTIRADGVQGHAAYTGLFRNANRSLVLALSIMNGYRWNDGSPGFPATNFEVVALDSGDFGSTSVIPGKAEALWNVRFTSRYGPEEIVEILQEQLDEPPEWARRHPDAAWLASVELTGNIDSVSHPYYSPSSDLAGSVSSAVMKQTGKMPDLDASGGVTDGRFVHTHFPNAEVVELGLPENGGESAPAGSIGKAGGMHQVDESCSLTDMVKLRACYIDIFAE